MQGKIKVRDRILNVATDLFYHQGFNQTGINQIIAEADIAIGSLYNHFPSKNELLLAYLKRQEQEWVEGFEQYSASTPNPKEKLFRYIDYRIESQKRSDFSGCPFIKIISELGPTDTNVLELVEGQKEQQRLLLYGLLKQIPYEGQLDKKQLADSLFLMIEGAIVNTTITRSTSALDQVKKFVKKIIG